MYSSVFSFCVILLCLAALNDAWFFRRRSRRRTSIRLGGTRCDSKRDCVSCTKHKSWSGKSCRWCPRDKKCHAHGAFLANPCSRTQNIVSASACSSIVTARYDRSLAYKMVYLSALAYADNVANYIPKAKEVCQRERYCSYISIQQNLLVFLFLLRNLQGQLLIVK